MNFCSDVISLIKMVYRILLIVALFALSAKSYEVNEEQDDYPTISCHYSASYTADQNINFIPLVEVSPKNEGNNHFTEIAFQANDEKIKVNVKPSEGYLIHKNTPVWTIKRQNDKVQFNLYKKALEGIESYTDEATNVSFTALPEQNGYYIYNAFYNYDTGIKPTSNHNIRKRDINNSNRIINHNVHRHPRSSSNNPRPPKKNSNLPAPDTVYPEILVIMDHKLYSDYGGNMKKALSYIITFWNAVDLKFRDFKTPKVRLNIAGIIIEEEPGAILSQSMILEDGQFKGKVNRKLVLTDIGKVLYKSHLTIKKDYDLAMYMMGNDLRRPDTKEDSNKIHGYKGLLGVAKVGSVCLGSRRTGTIDAVAAFEDTNGYLGILRATHELAHLFGAIHDGDEERASLGVPGAEHCKPNEEDDFLLSMLRNDGKKFSYCSKESMRLFFHKKSAECLRNAPVESEDVLSSIKLPGKVLSLDEQCQSSGYIRSYINDKYTCQHLNCVEYESNDITEYVRYLPAAEGSFCGYAKHCINGDCVNNTNIADYLQYSVIDKRNHIG